MLLMVNKTRPRKKRGGRKMSALILAWIKGNYEVIVALSALLVGLYGVWATRQHNKMSVRPFLRGHWGTQRNIQVFELRYDLDNDGIGPAFIVDFDFAFDGHDVDIQTSDDIGRFIQKAQEDNPAYRGFRVVEAGYGHSIKEGDSLRVLKITCPNDDVDKLVDFMNKFAIKIRYRSIYGETLRFSTDNQAQRRNNFWVDETSG